MLRRLRKLLNDQRGFMGVAEAVLIGAAVSAVGTGTAAYMSSSAQKSAANTSARAAQNATELQWQEFQQQQANLQPYLQAGYGALNQLSTGLAPGGQFNDGQPTLGQLQMDPGYAFRKQQGVNAITAAGAATGNLGSGALGTALTRYGQEMGSQEYGAAYNRFTNNENTLFNRLAGVAGTGQIAVGELNNAGGNMANNVGNIAVNQAGINGAAAINSTNAWAGAIGNIGNNLNSGLTNYYNQQQQMNLLTAAQTGMNYAPGSGFTYQNPAAVGPMQAV